MNGNEFCKLPLYVEVLSVLEMVIRVMSDQNMTTPIAAESTSVTMAIVALFMGMFFRSTILSEKKGKSESRSITFFNRKRTFGVTRTNVHCA